MKANWGEKEATVNSYADLDSVIRSARESGQPTMIFLQAENGSVLVFGIGHEESILTFAEPDGVSFHSLGNSERKDHLLFLCRDQVDEFMADAAIPEPIAVRAAEEFFTTQKRPSGVKWEADWGDR